MKKFWKLFRAGMIALAVASALAGTVLAYWEVSGTAVNVLTMSSYRTEIVEEYEIPEHVSPGTSADKKVHVKNSGTVDVLIRVKIKKVFGTRQADGTLKEDPSLDPELIQITCNGNYWKYHDGFWYYTEVLTAGKTTKEPLFDHYTVSEKAGNACKGKEAEIIVTMESIQAEGDAVGMWGIDKRLLGIQYTPETEQENTFVVFGGRQQGFTFDPKSGDLFANFKNLLPGCARTQKIMIRNASDGETEFFLRAEPASQEQMSSQQRKLVEQMLSEYAVITVKQGKNVLYHGPADGNLSGKGQNMSRDISLGKIEKNGKNSLTVTISLSHEMDNELQALTGKVKWIFSAEGQESTGTVSASVPKTGDTTDFSAAVASFVFSILLFCFACMTKRRSA